MTATDTVTACQRCGSHDIRTQGAEWRCASCYAKSPGYQARVLDDPAPFNQRPDPTRKPVMEVVRDPWAEATKRAADLGLVEPSGAESDPNHDASDVTPPARADYELVGDLVRWSRDHHDAHPSEADWTRSAPFGADPASVYIDRFGSWDAAIDQLRRSLLPEDDAETPPAAALASHEPPTPPVERSRQSRYTDQQLIGFLQAHLDAHGRAPSATGWKRDRPADAPSATTYFHRFGSCAAALAAAGMIPNPPGPARAQSTVDAPRAAQGRIPSQWQHDQVVAYLADHPDATKRDAINHVAHQIGSPERSVEQAYYKIKRAQRSQPASEAATTPAAPPLAETAAAAPHPPFTAVTTPTGEGSDAVRAAEEAPPASDAIEQQSPTNPQPQPRHEVETICGHEVDATDLATLPDAPIEQGPGIATAMRLHGYQITYSSSAVIDDARDELRLRYTRALLATLETAEVSDAAGVAWFDGLADRIERVLGIRDEAA